MSIIAAFSKIGINLSTFNSNLEKDYEISELEDILTSKLAVGTTGDIEFIQDFKKINENDYAEEFQGIIRKDDGEYTIKVTRIKDNIKTYFLIDLKSNNPQNENYCQILVEDHMKYGYTDEYEDEDTLYGVNEFSSSVVCQETFEINGEKFLRNTKLILGDLSQHHQKHLVSDLHFYPSGDNLEEPISRIVFTNYGTYHNPRETLYNCHIFPLEDDHYDKVRAYRIGSYSIDKRTSPNWKLFASLDSYERDLDYFKMISSHFVISNRKK